ncbi:MAG: fibronectin type III-like domain-contianing protein [Acidobacteria bacterium]|nr:fibronectin type III-like domain-contianing protein [Acidobacteriota bacterium]
MRLGTRSARRNPPPADSQPADRSGWASSKVARPRKELRGFQRVHVPRGQKKTVQIPLKAQTLAYWDEARNQSVVEEGRLQLALGGSSADERLKTIVEVVR